MNSLDNLNDMQKIAISMFNKITLPTILGGGALGAGAGAFTDLIHPRQDDSNSMLKRILLGAGIGMAPGLVMRSALSPLKKVTNLGEGGSFGEYLDTVNDVKISIPQLAAQIASLGRIPLGGAVGYMGDQVLTGGENSTAATMAGMGVGMGSRAYQMLRAYRLNDPEKAFNYIPSSPTGVVGSIL